MRGQFLIIALASAVMASEILDPQNDVVGRMTGSIISHEQLLPSSFKNLFTEIQDERDMDKLFLKYKQTEKLADQWLKENYNIVLYQDKILRGKSSKDIFYGSIYLQLSLDYYKMRSQGMELKRNIKVSKCRFLFVNKNNARILRGIQGGQSKIYRQELQNNQSLILKYFKSVEEAEIEQSILNNLTIPNVSVPICYDHSMIAFPYLHGGDLYNSHQVQTTFASAEETFLGPFFKKIAYTLHSLHQKGILHLDIKPENIMVDGPDQEFVNLSKTDPRLEKYNPILIDFGLAIYEQQMNEEGIARTGTKESWAPEQVWKNRISKATDWYQLGVSLWTCAILHNHSLADATQSRYINRVNKHNRMMGYLDIKYPRSLGKDLVDVLKMLLDPVSSSRDYSNPQKFQELMQMPFFN